MNIRRINFFLFAAVAVIAVQTILNQALFRDLWFDEALTFLNFAMLPDIAAIYKNYVIPNNQILFTVFLKYWSFYDPGLMMPDLHMRLLSLIFAGSSLAVIYSWHRYFSRCAVILTAVALALSLPFEIYAVALRAYMLSLFLLLLCISIAFRIERTANWRYYVAYFFASLAAVAALPSNIVALGGIALWFMPLRKTTKQQKLGWLMLAVLPILAMAMFYIPLTRQLRMILALREGWNNAFCAAIAFYAAFGLSFLPLLITVRSQKTLSLLKTFAVIMLPLPFFLLRTPAPFPRIFFPYWAVLVLPLLSFLNLFLARNRHRKMVYPALAGAVLIWAIGMNVFRTELSNILTPQGAMDDYFYPSYARPNFQPHNTIRLLLKQYGNNLPPIYVSFDADFYPLIFYGHLNGINPELWRFDNPHGKVESLPSNALVILSSSEHELKNFSERFGVHPTFLFSSGFHRVYQLKKK
ncbi:MAG: hypothetical protein PHS31_00050 [Victivallaceae bacterium]|nr:hypothetical protein [Victivallaceae bacterium]